LVPESLPNLEDEEEEGEWAHPYQVARRALLKKPIVRVKSWYDGADRDDYETRSDLTAAAKKRRKLFYEFFRREPLDDTEARRLNAAFARIMELERLRAERDEELREIQGIYFRDPDIPLEKGLLVKTWYTGPNNDEPRKKYWYEDPDDYETSPDFEDGELNDDQKLFRFDFNLRRIFLGAWKTDRRDLWTGIFFCFYIYCIYILCSF